jgi:protein involved in polysaccharide export with SLBB domain
MQAGEGGWLWRIGHARPAGAWRALILCLLPACAAPANDVELALLAEHPPATPRQQSSGPYRIGCPDELEFTATDNRHKRRCIVGPDGRIGLGDLGQLRVEGMTQAEAAAAIARRAGLPSAAVHVAVRAYRSQQVYLIGEVRGLQRAVPYEGPERVADLLQRVGGLTPGAAVGEVYLVRSHLVNGQAPEVFRVDLQAILMKQDQRTNVVVQPFDQITVGESPQSTLARSLPPLLLPLYQSLFGLQPK